MRVLRQRRAMRCPKRQHCPVGRQYLARRGRKQNRSTTSLPSLIYSRPFMKQQFDYPSICWATKTPVRSPKLSGRSSDSTPESRKSDEWYQPPETRFYKKDQG